MSKRQNEKKSIRLIPGLIIIILQWLAMYATPYIFPDYAPIGFLGGVIGGGLAILIWWAFFSRVPPLERWSALGLIAFAMLLTPFLLHKSITLGAMGYMFYFFVVPGLSLALVVWAALSPKLSISAGRGVLAAFILLACGGWALVKTGGFTGDMDNDFSWRWSVTPEEKLLALSEDEKMAGIAADSTLELAAEWPGFLGPNGNGTIHGLQIETNWSDSPPVEQWRRPIGPGWSSFAISGDHLYTQEQRGDDEVVACYKVSTGEPVWRHSDPARFWESNGGAGPRGTPTLHKGLVYTFGGTGLLNVLDAQDGKLIWSRNAAEDTDAETPVWGFSSSPLVLEDLVVVAVSGALAAYDIETGESRWAMPFVGESYCSPRLFTIDSVDQILSINGDGLISVTPEDGKLLWEIEWPGFPIVQPILLDDGDLLFSTSSDNGIRRVGIMQSPDGWQVTERWASNRLKPFYSDIVIHNGHAFGFDGSILACIDIQNGKRKWKGGRYGAGQLFLLADQGLLVVLGEKGDLALVEASSDKFKELARFPALEGKTWNHPAVVRDILLVRNAHEMAAYRLKLSAN